MLRDSVSVFEGISALVLRLFIKPCVTRLGGEFPAVHDASAASTAPWCAVLGLGHTTDPLAYITNYAFPGAFEAFQAARPPRRDTTFTSSVFSPSLPPRQGGPPSLDADRWSALRGEFAQATTDQPRDYAVLLSCGPFRVLPPGQSVEFAVAFIAGENADSLVA